MNLMNGTMVIQGEAMASKDKNIVIPVHEWICSMIGALRYGCSRNNHLEPSWTFDHLKKHLPQLCKKDLEAGLYALEKFCSETCEMLDDNFYDGLDDEHGNRLDYIKFIEWCVEEASKLGKDITNCWAYDRYKKNLERESSLKYRLYELESFDKDAKPIREITVEPVSWGDVNKLLFDGELESQYGMMNRITLFTEEYPRRDIGEIDRIIEPKTCEGKVYKIILERL